MVELIVYPKTADPKLINNSPFCSKSEIFLKLSKIEHKIVPFDGNPGKFPKKKLPVIKYGGATITDSSFIQNFLEKEFNVDMDSHLSAKEKAQGFAFAKMVEEYLYWGLIHERWLIDENWVKLRDSYFNNIPKLIRGVATNMIRKGVKTAAIGHGMGRHTDDEVFAIGRSCVKAIADFLEEKEFLLGNKISSYDTSIYAFVSSILHSPLGPKLKEEGLKYSNLVEYDRRMYGLIS